MGAPKSLIGVFGLTVLLQLISKISAADTISYIGAVAEYYPVKSGTNGTAIAAANARNYATIIQTASEFGVDIIVFPESSLTQGLSSSATNRTSYPSFSSIVPDPDTDVPCDNSSTVVIEALRLISCAAKTYSMYVVVNLHEMENCTLTGTTSRPCPSDGYFFYNTNVVFDRTGSIISRYRKFNLFGELGFNITSTPDIASFTTDFNVTFGHFICFDVLFKTPTLTYITDYNITDILFPLHWFSELPYLSSVQTQSAWSYANDVNLLASGYNTPASGSGGSGIYIGTSGNLVKLWTESARNALLVARIPKVIDGKRTYIPPSVYPLIYEFNATEITTLDGITTVAQQALIRDNLAPYTTSILTLTNGTTSTSLDLCDRGLCCSFQVNRTFSESDINSNVRYYKYRYAVFNGVRDHSGVATTGSQICSIIACTDDTLSSCGLRFSAEDNIVQPTVFNHIAISGNFSTDSTTSQMPDSLTTDILPLNASDFVYTKTVFTNTSVVQITYTSAIEIQNLFTFAIYGRNFSADGLPATMTIVESSASSFSRFSMTVTVFVTVTFAVVIRD